MSSLFIILISILFSFSSYAVRETDCHMRFFTQNNEGERKDLYGFFSDEVHKWIKVESNWKEVENLPQLNQVEERYDHKRRKEIKFGYIFTDHISGIVLNPKISIIKNQISTTIFCNDDICFDDNKYLINKGKFNNGKYSTEFDLSGYNIRIQTEFQPNPTTIRLLDKYIDGKVFTVPHPNSCGDPNHMTTVFVSSSDDESTCNVYDADNRLSPLSDIGSEDNRNLLLDCPVKIARLKCQYTTPKEWRRYQRSLRSWF
ncbi:hypothetical protein N9N67_07225 [Bacteriovoracaceae bacterium]|nr:hypothetical protein [Bacteriovoracaceae bacterium]